MAANKERTFIMVKPDGVQRGLVGKIIERFEQKGFKLVALKFTWVSKTGNIIELAKKKKSIIVRVFAMSYLTSNSAGGTSVAASIINDRLRL